MMNACVALNIQPREMLQNVDSVNMCLSKVSLIISLLDPSVTIERDFYPTALKGCRGIVFTHGVWMGVRCRKLILGRDII